MDSRDKLIAELRQLVADQTAQLQQQAGRIAQLELELAKAKKDCFYQFYEVAWAGN